MRSAMTDTARVPPAASAPVLDVQSRTQRTQREVRAHAAVYADKGDSADMQIAVAKLRRSLAAGEAFRPDVPRGYYLNFTV